MISDGFSGFRAAPHIALMPAFAITIILITFTLIATPTENIDYWRDLIKRNWYF
jgi:ABC-type dipeptide/oligopeptide/nickel transport system permease subunit